MNTRVSWILISILTLVIAILAVVLVIVPAPKEGTETQIVVQ